MRKKRSVRSRILLALVNLLSVGALIWALRDAHLGELRDDVLTMDWRWVAAAVAGDLCVYLMHGSRWRVLLRPVVRLGYWETVRSIYVGLFANEIIPLRAGELVRCYMLAQRPELPLSVSLTSALIERVFDGIWLSVLLLVTLRFVPLPRSLHYVTDGAYVLGATVIIVAGALSFALFRRHQVRTSPPKTAFQRQMRVLVDDLEIIGHSRSLWASFLQSLPYLLLQVIPIYAVMMGYDFDKSRAANGFAPTFVMALALMVILRLGSILPQAPGNIGIFQFLTRETLVKVFHAVPAEAGRFSLLLWGIVTLPLLIGGAVALTFAESSLGEIHESAQNERAALSNQHQNKGADGS